MNTLAFVEFVGFVAFVAAVECGDRPGAIGFGLVQSVYAGIKRERKRERKKERKERKERKSVCDFTYVGVAPLALAVASTTNCAIRWAAWTH